MNVPEDLRYSKDHEWARLEGDRVRVGITDYAQDALGDVVFIELPEVGSTVSRSATTGAGCWPGPIPRSRSPTSGPRPTAIWLPGNWPRSTCVASGR